MPDINAISQAKTLQSFAQTVNATNGSPSSNFMSLLQEIRGNQNASSANVSELNTNPAANKFLQGGTEAFLSSQKINENASNPIYNMIDTVNSAQVKADRSAAAFAAGYGDELEAALDISKADKYLKFFSEVRVKAVNAIRELSRVQI